MLTACDSSGAEPRDGPRSCGSYGVSTAPATTSAEYKQVTVLLADVVASMDIAAVVGPERLREITTELVERSAAVVQHYGGTVDKFTGDGLMAVFGAPTAFEDHALRACRAASEIQQSAMSLATDVADRDGIALQLRVGLNFGMAQRMESVAPPGGVMVSQTTARLVENASSLGERELVRIKGADGPVPARRVVATATRHERIERNEPTLIGRRWELSTIASLLDEVTSGAGCVVGVVGPAGIGKSRTVHEAAALAAGRGVDVFTTYCESHASDNPFHVVARLLRAGFRVDDLDDEAARARVRALVPDADRDDLLLLDDMLGIADPGIALPRVEADARRRRLTALVNAATLARQKPVLHVIEDAHWIDEVSESMLADFLAVVPQTPSMVLVTYRPEYQGALRRVAAAQTIVLRPLGDAHARTLIGELLGSDSSVGGLVTPIAERAAGNPFFAQEIVRDLAERGVLTGERGAYLCSGEATGVSVPASLQATIAARIDRLSHAAKRTLSGAAVIGSRFGADMLIHLGVEPALDELIRAELIDQVRFTPRAEYAFRHPLIRTVAYESQLKSNRAELHRRLAAMIEQHNTKSIDENAALIAEHLLAAGDLHGSFSWHMRAGTWLIQRDRPAARMSWQCARRIADRLPDDDPVRTAMRIAPRTLLCGTAWLVGGSPADTGFDELSELATAAGDKTSLAITMAGWVAALLTLGRLREASRVASEFTRLIDSIGDPALTIGLLYAALAAKFQVGETTEVLRLAQRVIDLAAGDPTKGGNPIIGSPLTVAITLRGAALCSLGIPGWKDDFERAVAMGRASDPTTRALCVLYIYGGPVVNGALLPDAAALRATAEILEIAERSGDDLTLAAARCARGLTLLRHEGPERDSGFGLLAKAREAALQGHFSRSALPAIDAEFATEKARTGDLDGAIELSRAVVNDQCAMGDMVFRGAAVAVLVESLLSRATDADLREAHIATERLAAAPTDPGFVPHELPLLRMRALLARAHGDAVGYHDFADRYRAEAALLGFEGHIALAEAMT